MMGMSKGTTIQAFPVQRTCGRGRGASLAITLQGCLGPTGSVGSEQAAGAAGLRLPSEAPPAVGACWGSGPKEELDIGADMRTSA